MTPDAADYSKGETPMTDLQFTAFVELQEKYEALLQEVALLRHSSAPAKSEDAAVSDYQFQRYEQVRDQCEDLNRQVASLQKENAKLKMQLDMIKSSSRRIRV